MAGETNNVVREHLRHIRAKVYSMAEAGQNSEIDRIKQRLDKIEPRLELADG